MAGACSTEDDDDDDDDLEIVRTGTSNWKSRLLSESILNYCARSSVVVDAPTNNDNVPFSQVLLFRNENYHRQTTQCVSSFAMLGHCTEMFDDGFNAALSRFVSRPCFFCNPARITFLLVCADWQSRIFMPRRSAWKHFHRIGTNQSRVFGLIDTSTGGNDYDEI